MISITHYNSGEVEARITSGVNTWKGRYYHPTPSSLNRLYQIMTQDPDHPLHVYCQSRTWYIQAENGDH